MLCPNCHADAPWNATACPQCGTGLPASQDDEQTVVGIVTPRPAAPVSELTAVPRSFTGQASHFARPAATGGSLQFDPGQDFGPRYRIESLLGEGGMGKVYKAYDKELDRIVALRLARTELANDPASTQRFKQELLLASRISHKNILRIHHLRHLE